ncbi:MAG: phosphatidylinositol-specific phospholipase C1-like protein [Phenylobacterium sp.]|uniref:phosphatidylinositol-specific phospholipase C1-like protein n=1 Tax=Phenylobacterium sp. TaxID=1871053 RepID=UPI00391BFB5B
MAANLILAAALALACDLEAPSGAAGCTRAEVDALKMNALQAVGTHNSYKLAISPAELAAIARADPRQALALDYAHAPLRDQLDAGARQLELDLLYDPEGGRYARPLGQQLPGAAPYDLAPLERPGLKVMHVQDIDYRSSCPLFRLCLEEIRAWSDAHPDHAPIAILINLKEGGLAGVSGATEAVAFDAVAMDAVDREIRAEFGPERLITPDTVQGAHPTLREAVAAGAWPTLGAARGKVFFALDAPPSQVEIYRGARRSLEGRAMFVNVDEASPAAAYITLNDPKADGARIAAALAAGLIVRTRADADTVEARAGDASRREAAFASGAQYVSTDYMNPDPRLGDYRVQLPGGGVARLRSAGR